MNDGTVSVKLDGKKLGTIPLLAGNSADSPEDAIAALTAEIEADEGAATDEADG